MKKLLTILVSVLLIEAAFSQSKPLDLSVVLTMVSGMQPITEKGKTNGYAPLSSNSTLVPATNLFPSFTNSPDGTLWAKLSNSFAPVSGLNASTTNLTVSNVTIGVLPNGTNSFSIYGIGVASSFPLVLQAGSGGRVYVATNQTIGGAGASYTNFTWSIDPSGNFQLGSGTLSGSLSVSGAVVPGTAIAVANGGTGATNAAVARANLGVAIETNVQAWNTNLDALSSNTYAGNTNIVTIGTVTNGSWNGSTIQITYGGTGANDSTTARANLGVAIGTDVEAWNTNLDSIASLTASNNYTLVGSGTNWTLQPVLTPAALGLVIGTNVEAWNTKLDQVSYGTYPGNTNISILGTVATGTWHGTPIGIANGGTGATNASNALTNLGLGGGISTNFVFLSISTTNSTNVVTNSIIISNGIIQVWNQSGL